VRLRWTKRFFIPALLLALCSFGAGILFVVTTPYSVTGQMGLPLYSGHVGQLTVIQGRPRKNGTPALHNWLYVMIICRDVQAAESRSSSSGINKDIMSYPLFHYGWATQNGTADVSFRWNTWTDSVSIGEQKFKRKNGNVFVVVRNPDGQLTTQQCGSLGPSAASTEIVPHIREQLPQDALVASVRVHAEK